MPAEPGLDILNEIANTPSALEVLRTPFLISQIREGPGREAVKFGYLKRASSNFSMI